MIEKNSDFDSLWLSHFRELYNYLLASTQSEAQADDIVQETAIRAFRHFGKLRSRKAFKAWIFKIAKNCVKEHYKKQKREPATESEILEALIGGQEEFESRITSEITIKEFLRQLPEIWQKAMYLYIFHDMNVRDVCGQLGINYENGQKKIHRIREKLYKIVYGIDYETRKGIFKKKY